MLDRTCKTFSDVGEQRCIRQVQRGDAESFEALVHLYGERIYRQALTLLKDEAEAEDITQEVFLTLHQKALTYRAEARLSTWIYRITTNAALSRLRRQSRRWETGATSHVEKRRDRGPADGSSTVEGEIICRENMERLQQSLETLPPLDQAVLVMTDIEGMTNQEAGHLLDLSPGAVKSRRYRARLLLRRKLEAVGVSHT